MSHVLLGLATAGLRFAAAKQWDNGDHCTA
jgi:hypothetical protein